MWNPVLFRKEDGKIILFYKVGKLISEWMTWQESEDEGHTFRAAGTGNEISEEEVRQE